jgi:hypothetical protein
MKAVDDNLQKRSLLSNVLAVVIILVFMITGILTLPSYSLTWDEGLGNLFFGDRYFQFFMTLNQDYLDFEKNIPSPQGSPNLLLSPMRDLPHEFPPIADTISAASMHLFAYKLRWIDPIDAFHLPKVGMSAVLLIFVFLFVRKEFGEIAAIFSILFLGTYPRFWGDMHFNPKDIPQTVFFSLTIFAYVLWFRKRTYKHAALAGALFGTTMGIKANAAFIPFILILGLWEYTLPWKKWRQLLNLWYCDLAHYSVMAIVAWSIYILTWPYLYIVNDPINGLQRHFNFILYQGYREGLPTHWQIEPSVMAFASFPEWTLIFLIIGIIISISMFRKNIILRLLLVWFSIPIFRSSMPGIANFDSIRHFMEFVPAACMLAGVGAQKVILSFEKKMWQRSATYVLLIGLAVNLSFIYSKIHPHEYLYYNSFVGGVPGAREVFGPNEVTDYWANTYRAGIDWLNQNALPDSYLYVPACGHLVEVAGPIWLNGDMEIVHINSIDDFQKLNRPLYVLLLYRPDAFNDNAKYIISHFVPIHQIAIEGIPLLLVYSINFDEHRIY